VLFAVDSKLFGSFPGGVFPKKQIANRKAAVHRIKQIADLSVGPDKWSLNIGQTYVANVDVVKQAA